MLNNESSTKATLTYDGLPPLDFKGLEKDLARVFKNIGIEIDHAHSESRKHATFVGSQISGRICRENEDVVVWIENGTSARENVDQTRVAACYHVVRHLLSLNRAECVLWHHTGKLYTSEGFEARIALDATPMKAPEESVQDQNIFADDRFSVNAMYDRLDSSFVRRIEVPKTAPFVRSAAAAGPNDIMISLEDPNSRISANLRAALYPDYHQDDDEPTIQILGPGSPQDRLDKSETVARLATYALNTTLVIAALPVGVGLLTYNMLGGENLRLTAQVTALTGAFLGTGLFDTFGPALGLI
ncbi:hypothetical protein [Brevirhabdus sp.]|uniref:hypothetical protein n=1 Tax=Brevirhabdus sp. TaxID=2004514 RepID=UPI0040592225